MTSSEHVTRELMQRLSLTLSVLSTDEQLNEKREGRTPTEWFSVTKAIKDKVVVNVSQVAEIQREMQERMLKSKVMDGTEVDTFRRFQAFVEEMKVSLPPGDASVMVRQDQAEPMEERSEALEINEHGEFNEDSDEKIFPEEEPWARNAFRQSIFTPNNEGFDRVILVKVHREAFKVLCRLNDDHF